MKAAIAAVFSLVLPFSQCLASPWIITGQTKIVVNTGLDNPVPADTGAVGAVKSLPYTVPGGCALTINAYGMEGYNRTGVSVLFLWTGDPSNASTDWRIAHGTASVAAGAGSQEVVGQRLVFPAGTIINVRLINGTTESWVFGWYVNGDLNCNGTP
jgi:hypothetical protein